MTRYVAFLRGINVGGNKLIKMEELRRTFEALRFKNVRTFIASGNVIFETDETDRELLTEKIERKIRKSFRTASTRSCASAANAGRFRADDLNGITGQMLRSRAAERLALAS